MVARNLRTLPFFVAKFVMLDVYAKAMWGTIECEMEVNVGFTSILCQKSDRRFG